MANSISNVINGVRDTLGSMLLTNDMGSRYIADLIAFGSANVTDIDPVEQPQEYLSACVSAGIDLYFKYLVNTTDVPVNADQAAVDAAITRLMLTAGIPTKADLVSSVLSYLGLVTEVDDQTARMWRRTANRQ